MALKKFENMGENKPTIKSVFGDIVETKNGVNKTSTGVYIDYDFTNHYSPESECILDTTYNQVFAKEPGARYTNLVGYLCLKDGKPHIVASVNGDERGCVVFNNTFAASGHDGTTLFNIDNPFERKSY